MVQFKQSSVAAVISSMGTNATAKQQSKYLQKVTSHIPLVATHFDEMPDSGYVRASVVLALFGISKATLWRWVKSSQIPAPKTIGRSSLFQVGQLRACLENLQSSGANMHNVRG